MSYDIELHRDGEIVTVPSRCSEGGNIEATYIEVDGYQKLIPALVSKADLNVTYNYAEVYCKYGFSIRDLDGQPAWKFLSKMEEIVTATGIKPDRDYWASTPGNAGYALNILLGWARLYPDAIWHVS